MSKRISIYAVLLALAVAVLIAALGGTDDAEEHGINQAPRRESKTSGQQKDRQASSSPEFASENFSGTYHSEATDYINQFRKAQVLFWAIEEGEIEKVRAVIKSDPGLMNFQPPRIDSDASSYPALLRAVERDQKIIVELLLDNGADPDGTGCYGTTGMNIAAERGDVEMAQLLLRYGADPSLSDPLLDAIARKELEFALLLLDAGATPNSAKLYADYTGDADDYVGEIHSTPALQLAMERNRLEIARAVLEAGANVNARNYSGCTALHIAVSIEDLDFTKVLLEHGADVNVSDHKGETPLHEAAFDGHAELTKMLLSHKAHVNAQDRLGRTPLRRAIDGASIESAKLLIAKGAGLRIKDKNGTTPFDLAKKNGILKELGLDRTPSGPSSATPLR